MAQLSLKIKIKIKLRIVSRSLVVRCMTS